ncbi:MAG: hypothetical protein E6Q97_14940 [Desulfurellales bacterium]|nr:MAG: hypothetical protein E6Q97_14940 [Desulfurellales bacterium]
MKAKAYNLRALGYSRLGTRNDPLPVPEVRYIVTNGRGRVESATPCILDDGKAESIAWEDPDTGAFLGTAGQFPWFKKDE